MLNNRAVRFCHQTAHTGQLFHLRLGTARAGIRHHEHGVHITVVNLGNAFHHLLGQLIVARRPDIDNLVVFFAARNQTVLILLFKFLNLFRGFGDKFLLRIRNNQVVLAERNTGLARIFKTERHNLVNHDAGFFLPAVTVNRIDDFADFLLAQQAVYQRNRDFLIIRQNVGNNDTSRRCFQQPVNALALVVDIVHAAFDFRMQVDRFRVQCQHNLVNVGINAALAGNAVRLIRQVVNTQNHVLRRHDNRLARCRRQNVVGGHHQHARFQLCFNRQRNVNRHLVAVEVGVKRGTNQRVQVDGLAFDQNRLKRLNTQTVQRRCAV